MQWRECVLLCKRLGERMRDGLRESRVLEKEKMGGERVESVESDAGWVGNGMGLSKRCPILCCPESHLAVVRD